MTRATLPTFVSPCKTPGFLRLWGESDRTATQEKLKCSVAITQYYVANGDQYQGALGGFGPCSHHAQTIGL
jgi:hypothetical protein